MSQTFTLQGVESVLSANYYPPIELDGESSYYLGLTGLHTYNTIPNIEEGCNKFIYHGGKEIIIPSGSYEITDIESYLQRKLLFDSPSNLVADNILSLKPNNSTLQCEIKSLYDIDFSPNKGTIGKLLGFSGREILRTGVLHTSDIPVQILKVSSIRVECNIVTGAYYDDQLSHTLFEFTPAVDPGYSINIEPRNIIYLPIVSKNSISNITISIVDQNGDSVNFRGERILIRLELKKI